MRLPALSLWTLASLQLNAEKEAKRRLEQELWVESRANAAYEAYRVNGRASDGKRVGAAPRRGRGAARWRTTMNWATATTASTALGLTLATLRARSPAPARFNAVVSESLGIGLGLSFVPITISATTGVAPEDSGLASGLLNTTQQVGGAIGLAILSTVATTRVTHALHGGAPLPVALTHGFKGGFIVAAFLCAAAAALALVLLPGRKREVENEQVEAIALSWESCPGGPGCGYLARLVADDRSAHGTPARGS